ncbi:MAG: SCO family protein [Betaproteobacteria bacterium]|nr:SCO family protein [Betaproteobacteria bacterium]
MNFWRSRILRACLACFVLLASNVGRAEPSFQNIDISGAEYGRDFALLDSDGKTRRLADFRGKAVMIFFGFIQCPEMCPTALQRAAAVRRLLGADGERLQIIFVTLDPERDSPQILREYAAAFEADVLGLYESLEKTNETAKAFRVRFRKTPLNGSYTIDHTVTSYIYDPQGRLRLSVPYHSSAESIAADVALLLNASPTN